MHVVKNDPSLVAFQSQLQAWAADPTCAADTVLQSRSSLSLADQIAFFALLVAIFRSSGQSSSQQAMLQLYSDDLQSVIDASPSDFQSYYTAFPGQDPVLLTTLAMCNGGKVGDVVSDQQAAASDLCVLPTDVSNGCGSLPPSHTELKRDTASKSFKRHKSLNETFFARHIKQTRNISPSNDETIFGPGQIPSYAAMMRAVMNGLMTFQYTRLVQIGDSEASADNFLGPTNQQQGILEVAWLVGTGNAVANLNADYQEFEGTDLTERPPPDSFFVMHFHIDHVLTANDGNAYVGVYAYNAFHGQYVNGDNRVDGNSRGRNARTPLMQCDGYAGPAGGEDRYIYPGLNTNYNSIDSVFLEYLHDELGVLTANRVQAVSLYLVSFSPFITLLILPLPRFRVEGVRNL